MNKKIKRYHIDKYGFVDGVQPTEPSLWCKDADVAAIETTPATDKIEIVTEKQIIEASMKTGAMREALKQAASTPARMTEEQIKNIAANCHSMVYADSNAIQDLLSHIAAVTRELEQVKGELKTIKRGPQPHDVDRFYPADEPAANEAARGNEEGKKA